MYTNKMAVSSKALFRIIAFLLVLASLGVVNVDASSSRTSRSSVRIRTSSSRSSSKSTRVSVRMYQGSPYSRGSWNSAAAAYIVYGLMTYKTRRLYHTHPDREPKICFNGVDLRNMTYGYFICPEDDQPDDWDYCCGPSDEQKCCNQSDNEAGKIVGIVFGVIAAAVIVGIVVYCCCYKKRQRVKKQGGILFVEKHRGTNPETIPMSPGPCSGSNYDTGHMHSTNPVGPYPPTVHVYEASTPGMYPGQYPPPGQDYGASPPGMYPGQYPPPGQDYGASPPGMYPRQYPPTGQNDGAATPMCPGQYPPPGQDYGITTPMGGGQYPPPRQNLGPSAPMYPGQCPPEGFAVGEKQPLPYGDTSDGMPYPINPYPQPTGLQDMPSVPPPAYSSN